MFNNFLSHSMYLAFPYIYIYMKNATFRETGYFATIFSMSSLSLLKVYPIRAMLVTIRSMREVFVHISDILDGWSQLVAFLYLLTLMNYQYCFKKWYFTSLILKEQWLDYENMTPRNVSQNQVFLMFLIWSYPYMIEDLLWYELTYGETTIIVMDDEGNRRVIHGFPFRGLYNHI